MLAFLIALLRHGEVSVLQGHHRRNQVLLEVQHLRKKQLCLNSEYIVLKNGETTLMQSALLKHEVSEIRVLSESAGMPHAFTAKTQYREFERNIPRIGVAWLQSQFPHSCVCERCIYSHDWSA
jgi:hypothetical protein